MPHPAEEHAALTSALHVSEAPLAEFLARHPDMLAADGATVNLFGFGMATACAISPDGITWWVGISELIGRAGLSQAELIARWRLAYVDRGPSDADMICHPPPRPVTSPMVSTAFVIRAFAAGKWSAEFHANVWPWLAHLMLAGRVSQPDGLTVPELESIAATVPDYAQAHERAMSGPLGALTRADDRRA